MTKMIKEITDSKRTWSCMDAAYSRFIQGQRNGWLYREKGGEIEKIKATIFFCFLGICYISNILVSYSAAQTRKSISLCENYLKITGRIQSICFR